MGGMLRLPRPKAPNPAIKEDNGELQDLIKVHRHKLRVAGLPSPRVPALNGPHLMHRPTKTRLKTRNPRSQPPRKARSVHPGPLPLDVPAARVRPAQKLKHLQALAGLQRAPQGASLHHNRALPQGQQLIPLFLLNQTRL